MAPGRRGKGPVKYLAGNAFLAAIGAGLVLAGQRLMRSSRFEASQEKVYQDKARRWGDGPLSPSEIARLHRGFRVFATTMGGLMILFAVVNFAVHVAR